MAARVPSAVLRNKGVPVEVCIVEEGRRLLAEDDAPRTTQTWVRIDANAMAEMEEQFGNLDIFDEQTRKQPATAIRKALAIAWDVPPKTAGLMMRDGQLDEYATAIAVALALANGVDPQEASELLEEGVRAVSEAKEARTTAVRELMAEDRNREAQVERASEPPTAESPGTNGGPNGSATATPSTPTASGA